MKKFPLVEGKLLRCSLILGAFFAKSQGDPKIVADDIEDMRQG